MDMEQVVRQNVKDSRVESLFTKDLTQLREINYDGYLANLTNWELVINEFINNEVFPNKLIVDTQELNHLQANSNGHIFKIGKGILNVVLNHMVNETEQLIPLSRFNSTPLDKSTINKIFHKMISSTIYNLDYNVGAKDGTLQKDQLVSVKKLKEASLAIYNFYKYEFLTSEEYSDYVIRKSHLFKLAQQRFKYTEQDLELVLKYLARDLKKIVMKGDVIKFLKEGNETIDENDEAVATLKSTSAQLDTLIEQVSAKQVDLKQEILAKAASGNKQQAKLLLQHHKKIEIQLQQKTQQLSNLTTLLDQINQQTFNKTLVSTITANSKLLERLNNSTDLDDLQEVLDTMSDNVDESQKISDILSSSNTNIADDEQVDKELEQLIEASQEKQSAEAKAADDSKDQELSDRLNDLKANPLGKTEFGVDDGSAKAAKTEIGKTEAGKTEAGKTEIGKTESGKTEVGKTEAGKTEIGKTEAGKTETGTVEKGKKEEKAPVYA